jgi:hypothetical protein
MDIPDKGFFEIPKETKLLYPKNLKEYLSGTLKN